MCDFYEARLMDLLALAPDEWQHIRNYLDGCDDLCGGGLRIRRALSFRNGQDFLGGIR